MNLPRLTAEASLYRTSKHYSVLSPDRAGPGTADSSSSYSGEGVVQAGDVTVFGCPCMGSTGTTGGGGGGGGGGGSPGTCECSGIWPLPCSPKGSSNCNAGYQPKCFSGLPDCGCQCVPIA
jgi:hypothetical protein